MKNVSFALYLISLTEFCAEKFAIANQKESRRSEKILKIAAARP